MSENAAIEIFLRVRPSKKPFSGLTLAEDDQKVMIHIPKDKSQGYINNQRENHVFAFNGMFNMEAKQNDVFLGVAKDVIDDAFEGYNGTIFAYGQTGSGKTFTMTGGAERYEDRGIIPRTLSYVFQEARNRTDTFYKISVSYIEIYNNEGYDLLDANHNSKNLSDLPKVIPREKPDGTLILSGLSVHKADDEEKALNLLFIGDTNRIVSETPKNDASTRSHCIFMIQIEGEKAGFEGKKTISRINLVDLSGSERVGKTQVQGLLLTEARFINQSLHFLEQVISVLNKKARGENVQHIPYRNSMMTQILKDSLGGNCKTRMIATISAEKGDIDESICTCNFAMRVAEVRNDRRKNEVMDPALIIQKLKLENQMLKAQIAAMSGQGKSFLDQSDQDKCRMMVEDFISNPDPNSKIILSDMLMIQECFYYFRNRVKDLHRKAGKEVSLNATTKLLQEGLDVKGDNKMIPNEQYNNMNDEIKRLKLLVQQRDNEISILLNLINKQGTGGPDESVMVPVSGAAQANFSVMMGEEAQDTLGYKAVVYQSEDVSNSTKKTQESKYNDTENILPKNFQKEVSKPHEIVQTKVRNEESIYNQPSTMTQTVSLTRNDLENMLVSPLHLTNEQLKDRAQCWEMFRKSYRKNQAMEENKEVLREKVTQAKQLGNNINNSRNEISRLKNQIEDLRRESAKQGLMSKDNQVMKHPDEDRLAEQIERHKNIYREGCVKLKDLKAEIENIQTLMERNSQKMQKDFEKWLDVILAKNANPAPPIVQAEPSNVLRESQRANLNNSVTSNTSSRNKSTTLDPAVASNLAAFYKARDEIYKS